MSWFAKKRDWPDIEIEEIRKRARILVIDDSDFAYLSLFVRDGYTIEQWDDVVDLQKLESNYYDVILLDIQGVGKEVSREEGLGVLKHIKERSPAQIVIAFSNADFSLKYQSFFDMADVTMAKGDDYVAFKRAVDDQLSFRFSSGFYIDRVVKLAKGSVSDSSKLKSLTSDALLYKKVDKLESFLESNRLDAKRISMILQVIQVGISIAAL